MLKVNEYGGRQAKGNEKKQCLKGWETLVSICFGIMLLFNVPLYPNLIELTLSVSTLFVNYINIKDYIMMDTEKTITFGIWGEMGVRSFVKANIMSVKINDFPLPPIRRAACVALSFYILRPRNFFCLFSSCFCFCSAVGCVCPVLSGSFTFLVASLVLRVCQNAN